MRIPGRPASRLGASWVAERSRIGPRPAHPHPCGAPLRTAQPAPYHRQSRDASIHGFSSSCGARLISRSSRPRQIAICRSRAARRRGLPCAPAALRDHEVDHLDRSMDGSPFGNLAPGEDFDDAVASRKQIKDTAPASSSVSASTPSPDPAVKTWAARPGRVPPSRNPGARDAPAHWNLALRPVVESGLPVRSADVRNHYHWSRMRLRETIDQDMDLRGSFGPHSDATVACQHASPTRPPNRPTTRRPWSNVANVAPRSWLSGPGRMPSRE
jgi:hypothetical protein